MHPGTAVTDIKGVGESLAQKFANLGVNTVEDLIDYLPRGYEDYSVVLPINRLKPGIVTIQARILSVTGRYVRRGMHITEAVASDKTGSVRLVWFNQPYRANSIDQKNDYYIRGDFGLRRGRLSIVSPSIELVKDFPLHTARIVPMYKLTKGLKATQVRKIMKQVIDVSQTMPETLPSWLVENQTLMPKQQAIRALHFPESDQELAEARKRFGFEEVFRLTLASLLNKRDNESLSTLKIPFQEKLAKQFVSSLPFKLTDDQRKVAWQLCKDLEAIHPMNRLVEGDVGSGKTVVASMAIIMALSAGLQIAFMAPTEILANQHAETLSKLLKSVNMDSAVVLLTGGVNASQRKIIHKQIALGKPQLVIGTHALFQEAVSIPKLGLVIIDEQHRFGVEQRKKLQSKAKTMPHLLSLTATPIPRSLALTLYGELDVSVIAEKPVNRQPIQTKIVSPNSRQVIYEQLEKELADNHQAFIVCPAITDTDNTDVRSVEQVFNEFKARYKSKYTVELLHGKMKSKQKDEVMQKFRLNKIHILVSTTVIEVGVDVPNASVLVIENADKFGLAQIHQLRGRVGRGDAKGHCFLVNSTSGTNKRLQALTTIEDGFALAELDMELRGPGEIYGISQHGALDLRVAKLSDVKLITVARQAAQEFIDRKEKLVQYKELSYYVSKLRTVTNLN